MFAPLFLDFSNRKNHPYSEFPQGIEIVSFQNGGLDSITIKGDYAINYTDTFLSHLVGNVVVVNHKTEVFWKRRKFIGMISPIIFLQTPISK